MQVSTISGEVFQGILERIEEHNSIQRIVAEQLEKIAESLPIPFLPVERPLATPDPKASLHNEKLLAALQIVRNALDEGHTFPGAGTLHRDRLFHVEAILSAELGEPVWEGRRS